MLKSFKADANKFSPTVNVQQNRNDEDAVLSGANDLRSVGNSTRRSEAAGSALEDARHTASEETFNTYSL
jgi:hypothetical protein